MATGSTAEPPPLLSMSFQRGDLGAVRQVVSRLAQRQGLRGSRLDGFVLAVNEIVTNAIAHGGGQGRLRVWRIGRDLACEVTDEGPGIDPKQVAERPRPAPTEVHGRGLWLARQLCDLVSVAAGPRGTTVRLVTTLPRPT